MNVMLIIILRLKLLIKTIYIYDLLKMIWVYIVP